MADLRQQQPPRLAAALDTGLAADVTEVTNEDGRLAITRPVYAGKTYLKLKLTGSTQVVSVRPNTFPVEEQERRTLPNGTEFFGASGRITNIGTQTRTIPTILIVLRDRRDAIVYSWEVPPPQRELAPGETVTINEAVTDIPRRARFAEFGWKPE